VRRLDIGLSLENMSIMSLIISMFIQEVLLYFSHLLVSLFIKFNPPGMDSTDEFVKMAHKNVDGLLGDMCVGKINVSR
jgi:hypothetical protein